MIASGIWRASEGPVVSTKLTSHQPLTSDLGFTSMASHSRVATSIGTPGCCSLVLSGHLDIRLPSQLHHLGLTLDRSLPSFRSSLSSSQMWSVGILHADLNLTYLKISGVLGLGGGSADCGAFRKNEEGEDGQRKSEGEGENRLLMVIWNIAPDPKTKTSFLGGLWGKGTIRETVSLPPTWAWALPVQQLHDPELVSGEGFVDLKPQLDSFPVFFKSSDLQLMFATLCDISGYLKSTQHPLARHESPFNVYSLFCTECQSMSSGTFLPCPLAGTAASLSPTLSCQKESRNLDAGPLSAPVLILSPQSKHRLHHGQAAIILPYIWGEISGTLENVYTDGRKVTRSKVLSSASADLSSNPSLSLRFS